MAECSWCNKNMSDESTKTCTENTHVEFPDGSKLPSVSYDGDGRCHDCNIASSGFHHPGCDMERCPKCGGQLISCGCLDNEEDEE